MKLKYLFILILFQIIIVQQVYSQEQDYYQLHLDQGKAFIDSTNYVEALSQFELAKKYIPNNDEAKKKEIEAKTTETRDAIIRLYEESEIAKNKAKSEQKKAEYAKAQADAARILTQQSLAKTQKIINAFYFYDEEFALAYKNNKYGFINKNGDIVINYLYEDARPFDYTGLSWVKRNTQTYLLDNKKNEYELAKGIKRITDSTKALDLSNLELVNFPENITNLTNLRILLINNNEIKKVPASIGNLHQLKKLFIYDNVLSKFPNSIGSLSNLITLDASINNLVELPDSIGQLTNLEELILYDNNLTNLPPELGDLHKLFFLDVSNNLLDTLPDEIAGLDSLMILALGENQFNKFPTQLDSLNKLMMLDLSDNYIDTIPAWIENFTMLSHLYLWNNKIKVLPKEIIKLDSLKVLIAGENRLSSLPLKMDSLTKLEELNLYGNQLTSIPAELGKMKELKKLDLRKNAELNLSQSLSVFSTTEKQLLISSGGNDLDYLLGDQNLLIKFDEFNTLPTELAKIENLILLDIINCRNLSASEIRSAFTGFPKKVVYSNDYYPQIADTNQLQINVDIPFQLQINVDIIPLLSLDKEQVQKFEELDLSNRKLSTIPSEVFTLTNLLSLNLSGNNLTEIPAEIIDLKKLKTLNLVGNHLPEEDIERIKSVLPNCIVYYESVSL